MEITQQSKVKIMFVLEATILPQEATIEWYMEQMEGGNESIAKPWYWFKTYDYLWEIKATLGAIVSWLAYMLEADNLFYTIKDNEIYIDRLNTKERVR